MTIFLFQLLFITLQLLAYSFTKSTYAKTHIITEKLKGSFKEGNELMEFEEPSEENFIEFLEGFSSVFEEQVDLIFEYEFLLKRIAALKFLSKVCMFMVIGLAVLSFII
jgi:hypothetical protein